VGKLHFYHGMFLCSHGGYGSFDLTMVRYRLNMPWKLSCFRCLEFL
jgi:hypothetical protein